MFGVQLALSPLLIDVEVLLGDPSSGTLVGKGFGNAFGGAVTIEPHTSSTSASASSGTSTAMSPTNQTALVPANHTGTQGTLYVTLVNSGLAGAYNYNSENSQLFVLVVPAETELATVSTGGPLVTSLATLTAATGYTTPAAVATTLTNYSGGVTTPVQTALDNVANALGHTGTGHTLSDLIAWLEGVGGLISGTLEASLANLLSALGGVTIDQVVSTLQATPIGTLTSAAQSALDSLGNLLGISGSGLTIASVVDILQATPVGSLTTDLHNALNSVIAVLGGAQPGAGVIGSVLSAFSGTVTTPIQTAVDSVVNSLGVTGTGHPLSTLTTLITNAAAPTVPPALTTLTTSVGGTTIPAVITNLENFAGTVTSDVQNALDTVATSLGSTGIGHTISTITTLLNRLI